MGSYRIQLPNMPLSCFRCLRVLGMGLIASPEARSELKRVKMHLEIPDDSLTAAVRRIVRDELAAFFEPRVAELKSEPQAGELRHQRLKQSQLPPHLK